eukprot:7107865-Pyramimonas_sp.AAC.1
MTRASADRLGNCQSGSPTAGAYMKDILQSWGEETGCEDLDGRIVFDVPLPHAMLLRHGAWTNYLIPFPASRRLQRSLGLWHLRAILNVERPPAPENVGAE